MVLFLIEDADDVPVGLCVHNLDDIRARWQDLSARAWDFEGRAESENSLPVPIISGCGWHDEDTEHSETQCDS
jgi:hypothetical protein